MGRLTEEEMDLFAAQASGSSRISGSLRDGGFIMEEAREEALRCLHCDCRKAKACKLRDYGAEYNASPKRYNTARRPFAQQIQHPEVIYESGKCISCGLCIQIAARSKEDLGLSFVGRGFAVRVAVPFNRSLADGLKRAARDCVRACPTGALALKGYESPRLTE